jgi:beta-phosphoglucomutase-like phosphatase (HAD superfamily)
VTCNKPDPEPYLAAAKRLGVDPLRCIAIEDSLNGTLSAQRAGCLVIAVPTHVPIDEAARRIVLPTLTGISLQQLAPIGTT